MTKLENALVWLYVMTWEKFGEHVINEKDLWNFGGDDLEAALMGLAFPRKNEKTERTRELNKLIMGKFETGGLAALREWAGNLHNHVSLNSVCKLYMKYFSVLKICLHMSSRKSTGQIFLL